MCIEKSGMRYNLQTASVFGTTLFYLEAPMDDPSLSIQWPLRADLPTAEEVARKMAMEMYPHKFGLPRTSRPLVMLTKDGIAMISPEANEKANRLAVQDRVESFIQTGNPLELIPPGVADDVVALPAVEVSATSPISRLFAAVRAVMTASGVVCAHPEYSELQVALVELHKSYNALGLKDDA